MNDHSYKPPSLIHSEDCELCAVLTPNEPVGACFILRGPHPSRSRIRYRLLAVAPEADEYPMDCDVFAYLSPEQIEGGPADLWPWPVQDSPDYDAARAWLAYCQTHRCHDEDPTTHVERMHLIDVKHRTVVKAKDLADPRWIMLSCW